MSPIVAKRLEHRAVNRPDKSHSRLSFLPDPVWVVHYYWQGRLADGYHRDMPGIFSGSLGYHFRAHNSKRKGILGRFRFFGDRLYSDNTIRVYTSPLCPSLYRKLIPAPAAQRREGYSPHLMDKDSEVQRCRPAMGGRTRVQTTMAYLPWFSPSQSLQSVRNHLFKVWSYGKAVTTHPSVEEAGYKTEL